MSNFTQSTVLSPEITPDMFYPCILVLQQVLLVSINSGLEAL